MKVFVKFALLVMLVSLVAACGQSGGKVKELKPENGIIKISLSDVSDGKAHHFYTKVGNKDIKYFVLKSSDGVVRTAFDACDVCFREKKGYSQDGDFMVCNNCGMRFHSRRINEVKGGCNPSPLVRDIDQAYLYIKSEDIASGGMYF